MWSSGQVMRLRPNPRKYQRLRLARLHAPGIPGPCLSPRRPKHKPPQLLSGILALLTIPHHFQPLTHSLYLSYPGLLLLFPWPCQAYSHRRAFGLPMYSTWSINYSCLVSHSSSLISFRSRLKCHFLREAFAEHPIYNTNLSIFFAYLALFSSLYTWRYICLLAMSAYWNISSRSSGILFIALSSAPRMVPGPGQVINKSFSNEWENKWTNSWGCMCGSKSPLGGTFFQLIHVILEKENIAIFFLFFKFF